jgi:hypothetical protein
VDLIHHLLGSRPGTEPFRDEQPDNLALPSLGLLANDGEVGRDLRKLQCALDGVVVGQADAIEAALAAACDQVLQRALAIVRKARVEVKVDADQPAKAWPPL